MRELLALLLVSAFLLTGCSQSLRDTDPEGYEACVMLDRARDKSVDVDERLELAVFRIGEQAALAKTQGILDGIEEAEEVPGLASMPKYKVKESLAETCRTLGVSVRDVTKAP